MAKRTISVHGVKFEINAPYAEGYTLAAREALALNQVRAENVANNCRKSIKEMVEEEKPVSEIQALVAKYDTDYSLATAATGGGRTMDPVEREARAIAKLRIKEHLVAKGRKVSDIEKEKFNAEVERVAAMDVVVAAAKKAVKAREGGEVEFAL